MAATEISLFCVGKLRRSESPTAFRRPSNLLRLHRLRQASLGRGTVRFILDFDPNSVKLALQCWEKLSLYAQP